MLRILCSRRAVTFLRLATGVCLGGEQAGAPSMEWDDTMDGTTDKHWTWEWDRI